MRFNFYFYIVLIWRQGFRLIFVQICGFGRELTLKGILRDQKLILFGS